MRRSSSRHTWAIIAALALVAPVFAPQLAAAAAPETVVIAGSLQSEVGCTADWQPDCAQSQLVYDDEDGLWQATFALPAGAYEYKAALNGSWDENYGAGGRPNGANLGFTLTEPAQVSFRYDPITHAVASSADTLTPTAVGTFQDELGCAADWKLDCLRAWLQDLDGDGVYTAATTRIPAGTYDTQVQVGDQPYPAQPQRFVVPADGDQVTFRYTAASHAVAVDVDHKPSGLEPGDEKLAKDSLRKDLAGEKFYFVMPDRFANGNPRNDKAHSNAGRLVHGYDPTDKGFYHGGDLAGLHKKLDYIDGLGTTAIWMTPMFANRWVQGSGNDISAGYHGYWTLDFTRMDPHFGTNAEMAAFIDAAHRRGIKVFFDIVANHTADVIDYAEKQYSYRNKAAYPYIDADGNEFDDRQYAGKPNFPKLTPDSFPYTPTFRTAADAKAKTPAWLNDVTLYHNRGDSTFSGENSEYGDFFGLDDLFTEHPRVVKGMTDIFTFWIDKLKIDGYRVDTVKHVNMEFWRALAPAVKAYATKKGRPDFFVFGEVFDSDVRKTSQYTTAGKLQSTLDFPFQSATRGFAAGKPTALPAGAFDDSDYYTDADSNAYSLPTFLGNHDMGRIGNMLRTDLPQAGDPEVLARDQLAHALLYLSRGNPVVYYGDEQGFVGDGGDKDARQDMFASKVASYNDDDLIGTDKTTATDSYGTTHPLYQRLKALSALTAKHKALRSGAQIQRYSTGQSGLLAFSRIDRKEKIEYLVALNNSTAAKTAAIPTFSAGVRFDQVWPGAGSITTAADKRARVTVPALSAVVYRATAPVRHTSPAPGVTINPPEAGSEVKGRVELRANVGGEGFNQVTFAVKPEGTAKWRVVGTDDNAPYRVFHDVSGIAKGKKLQIKAIVKDPAGHLNADRVEVTVGAEEPAPPPGAKPARGYQVVHYQRADGNYDGWDLDVSGDVATAGRVNFAGRDSYGPYAWVKLKPDATAVTFAVTKDGVTDGAGTLNPKAAPEVWLRAGTTYTSRAEAQGYVTVHYRRPAGDYDGWGVYVFGGVDDSELTTWPATRPFTGTDSFGVFARVKIKPGGGPVERVGVIVQKNGEKDVPPDRFVDPAVASDVWFVSGDEATYPSQGDAQDYAVIHYHRDDNNYDGWTIYHWTGSASPTPSWEQSPGPDGTDAFGAFWKVPLLDGAPALNYIIHKGDAKDPGSDQTLDLDGVGHEVWFLSGSADANGRATYLLPIVGGPGADADLTKSRAVWLTRDTVAWKVAPAAGHAYSLRYSTKADIVVDANGAVTGGQTLRLDPLAGGLPAALKAKFPHLADYPAFTIRAGDLPRVPAALTGQVVAIDRDAEGALRSATGVQVAGVLDNLYAGSWTLGPQVSGARAKVALWAPTAQSVKLRLRDAPRAVPMARDARSGVWSAAGNWTGKYYQFEVVAYAPSTRRIETNVVTDPYSTALAANSTHSLFADLSAAPATPAGWAKLRKSPPAAHTLYELHVRDFSIGDSSVPPAWRGTYKAFTAPGSDGMKHLRGLAQAGLTTVHLLPTFDIATIAERRSDHQTPDCDLPSLPPDSDQQQACVAKVADTDGFNWGYDPYHYNAPEGSYATNPDGVVRTREYREMVAALDRIGLRVVADVVYNHTAAAGQDSRSVLDRVVPGYYQRLDADGAIATSTCCANTAPENAMMGKLVVDSVVHWARTYKIDGFRFDLMGHHPKANILAVRAALDRLTLARDGVDGKKILLYGEGWNFGEVANDARFVQATQANMAGTGVATFTDRLRDAVRGGGPFDDDPRIQGFASGLFTDPNASPANGDAAAQKARLLHYQDLIKLGLAGNLRDYRFVDSAGHSVKGSEVDYNGAPAGYAAQPREVITYVDAHDNEALYDALAYKLPASTPMADRVRMQQVALATAFLGQGVPFVHAGSEILRSKSLDRNSFNSGDWFNRLDYSYRSNGFGSGLPPAPDNASKWGYARPLLGDAALRPSGAQIVASRDVAAQWLAIRRSSPLFTLGRADLVQQKVSFPLDGPDQPAGLVVMRIDDTVGPDVDRRLGGIVVVFNAADTAQTVTVPGLVNRRLALHPVQASGADPVVRDARASGGVLTVPARTVAVFTDGG